MWVSRQGVEDPGLKRVIVSRSGKPTRRRCNKVQHQHRNHSSSQQCSMPRRSWHLEHRASTQNRYGLQELHGSSLKRLSSRKVVQQVVQQGGVRHVSLVGLHAPLHVLLGQLRPQTGAELLNHLLIAAKRVLCNTQTGPLSHTSTSIPAGYTNHMHRPRTLPSTEGLCHLVPSGCLILPQA